MVLLLKPLKQAMKMDKSLFFWAIHENLKIRKPVNDFDLYMLLQVMAIVLILHFVTYAIATIINPADDYILRKEKKGASASLDRSLHKHAIEDGFCYLCESSV